MASTRIELDQTKPGAAALLSAISQLVAARNGLRTALACLNSASYGSDWAGVEAYLGCSAGTGQDAWTLVATATPLLDAAALDELISRMTRG